MRFVATSSDIVLLRSAIDKWGLGRQCLKALEEMAELSVVLAKFLNNEDSDVSTLANTVDEIADVYIMLHSLAYGFRINEAVDNQVACKMERLLTLVL